MSAYWKIPLQALVLLIGVLVFVFYQFERPPLLYNPQQAKAAQEKGGAEYAALQARYDEALDARTAAAHWVATSGADGETADGARIALRQADSTVGAVRAGALALAEQSTGAPSRDVNYIIPHFVLNHLPIGLAGLFIAGVMAAAMSSIAAELNSLSTSTVIDFYRRWVRPTGTDAHYLTISKAATGVWGIFACVVATYAATLGSLIEVVNRFGSFFYGSILGVFLLAMIPHARAIGAFVGLIAGMGAVASVARFAPEVSFLWHNVIGAVTVVVVGTLLSALGSRPTAVPSREPRAESPRP